MASKTGIRQWTEQRIIGGARVAFDPRSTEKVETTRDANNYKASEKGLRMYRWECRQAEERARKRAEAAE